MACVGPAWLHGLAVGLRISDRYAAAMAGRWGALEVFKFACYISIPICMTYFIAGKPEVLEAIIKNRSYVVYPPEAKRPPTAEELVELLKKQKSK